MLKAPILGSCSSEAWHEYFRASHMSEETVWWKLPQKDQEALQLYAAALAARNTAIPGLHDRSIFDVMVYTKQKLARGEVSEMCHELVHNIYEDCIERIDGIIYFKRDPKYSMEKDLLRNAEDTEVDGYFEEYITRWVGKAFVVPNGTIDEKAEAIIAYIKRLNFE